MQVYEEGTHLMVPWFDRPIIYDVRAKPVNIQSVSGSKDLQTVSSITECTADLPWSMHTPAPPFLSTHSHTQWHCAGESKHLSLHIQSTPAHNHRMLRVCASAHACPHDTFVFHCTHHAQMHTHICILHPHTCMCVRTDTHRYTRTHAHTPCLALCM